MIKQKFSYVIFMLSFFIVQDAWSQKIPDDWPPGSYKTSCKKSLDDSDLVPRSIKIDRATQGQWDPNTKTLSAWCSFFNPSDVTAYWNFSDLTHVDFGSEIKNSDGSLTSD